MLLAWLIVCVFTDGTAIGYMTSEPGVFRFALASLVLTCTMLPTVFAAMSLLELFPPPDRMAALAGEIHREVQLLVESGCTKLLPRDTDPQTIYLLIKMDGSTAVIDRVGWHEIDLSTGNVFKWRRYMIDPSGRVTRRIGGKGCQPCDRTWRNEPLTAAKLEYVLHALRHHYSPRYALTP